MKDGETIEEASDRFYRILDVEDVESAFYSVVVINEDGDEIEE